MRRGQAACGVQGGAALRSRWAWILQDALGVVFCLYMLKTIRLPTFKVRASGVSWRGGGSGDVGAGPGQPASWGPLPSGRRPAPFPALPGASRSRLTLSGWYGLHVFVPPATRLSSAVAFCHGTKVATWPRGRMVSWPTWALQGGSFLLTAQCWGWCPVAPGGGGEGGDHMGRGACLGLSTPVPGPGCLPRPRSDETDLGPVKTGHGCVSPDPTSPMPLAQKPRVHFSPQPPALPQALALSPPPPEGQLWSCSLSRKGFIPAGQVQALQGARGGPAAPGSQCPQDTLSAGLHVAAACALHLRRLLRVRHPLPDQGGRPSPPAPAPRGPGPPRLHLTQHPLLLEWEQHHGGGGHRALGLGHAREGG